MSLEKLIQRIQSEAEREKKEIIKKAEEEAKKIINEAEEEARRDAEKIIERAKKDADRIKEKILASARRKARMHIVNAKEEIINECYEKVREKLRNLDSREYKKIVERELKKALKEIKKGYVMISRKEDEEIAKKYSLEVKGKIDCLGGMILKSEDNSKEIDLTFDFLLERKKNEIRIEIAKNLFG